MATDLGKIEILTRREIEARIAVPLIKGFVGELGRERALRIAEGVIIGLARESGIQLAKNMGGNTIADFARGLGLWTKDDALIIEILEQTHRTYFFNVTRCRYAEMYREIGMLEFGSLLSCRRDFEMIEGFNPKMKLIRTQTIMDGKDYCDFRITLGE
jgi:hypothetical protein